uniref:glycosyltransferase family 2 protein n=1 Tax=Algoriphagus sp. TaxID=1872435 RepID=UPI0040489DE1
MCILSIVIPTFNRDSILNETLNSLLIQFKNIDVNEFELVISDNCSTDNTNDVVFRFCYENPNLNVKYNRNNENLGFDNNCIIGASLSKGKFIWFMSDDDELKENAIVTLIDKLNKNKDVVFVFLNYTLVTPGWPEGQPLYLLKDQIVDCNDLMKITKYHFSCITSCVFNRINFFEFDTKGLFQTFWIHLYIVKFVAEKGRSLIISKPLFIFKRPSLKDSRISANKNKILKREFFIDAHINFLNFLNSFEFPYSVDVINYGFNFGWSNNFKQILSYKLTIDHYNFLEIKSIYSDMKFFYSKKILFWTLHTPILFLPRIFSNVFFFFILIVSKLKVKLKPYVPNQIFLFYKLKISK